MTTTPNQTDKTTTTLGFWKRLWQGLRRLFKREKASGCPGQTTSATATAHENKAAA